MLMALLVNLVAFTVLYAALLARRIEVGRLEEIAEEVAPTELAGRSVQPPPLGEVGGG